MTKDKMEARIRFLESELGIQNTPTKLDEIETLEADTMVKIINLMNGCEKITGRPLKEIGHASCIISNAKESSTPLRCMVEELRDYAMNSGHYNFENEYVFAKWVFSKLSDG